MAAPPRPGSTAWSPHGRAGVTRGAGSAPRQPAAPRVALRGAAVSHAFRGSADPDFPRRSGAPRRGLPPLPDVQRQLPHQAPMPESAHQSRRWSPPPDARPSHPTATWDAGFPLAWVTVGCASIRRSAATGRLRQGRWGKFGGPTRWCGPTRPTGRRRTTTRGSHRVASPGAHQAPLYRTFFGGAFSARVVDHFADRRREDGLLQPALQPSGSFWPGCAHAGVWHAMPRTRSHGEQSPAASRCPSRLPSSRPSRRPSDSAPSSFWIPYSPHVRVPLSR